jgi:hypothetical protein
LVQALGSGTPEGVSLSALGTFELRGIPGKEVLYEVGAA